MAKSKSFDIHKTKDVKYLYDEQEICGYLNSGWRLLSAGFHTKKGESVPCCILGQLPEEETKQPEEDSLTIIYGGKKVVLPSPVDD